MSGFASHHIDTMAALMRTAVRPFVAAGARRTMAIDAKLVRFERFGAPQNVLRCVALQTGGLVALSNRCREAGLASCLRAGHACEV